MASSVSKSLVLKVIGILLCVLVTASGAGYLLGCAAISRQFFEQPKVSLASVNVKDVTATGSTLVFGIKVDNPNAVSLRMDSLQYDLEIGGKPFSSGQVAEAVEVAGHSTAVIDLPVPVKYADLFSSILSFLSQGATHYKIKGEAKVGLFTIPFENAGDFKLKP